MKDLKVGDKVWLGCYTSIGASSEGESTIEEVDYRYNEKTGEKYKVYKVGSAWYNEAGHSVNKESMYYIEEMHSCCKPVPKKRIIDADTAELYANFDMTAVKKILSGMSEKAKPNNSKKLTTEEKKKSKRIAKMEKELIQKYIDAGHDQQQAEDMTMLIMHIAGLSAPTSNIEK